VYELFSSPAHPYTQGLLSSIPKPDFEGGRLTAIPGYVPSPLNYPSGCHFQDRCAYVFERCKVEVPPLREISAGRRTACFLQAL
jgi:oligopeptide/dipeptide ABC transporter ATP-binding protein